GEVQKSRGRGSDGGRSSLPSGITTERVTSVVVANSRDHTHRRARSTKVLAVTSTRGPGGHHRTPRNPRSFVLWAAKQRKLLTGRFAFEPDRGYFFFNSRTSSASARKRRSSSACSGSFASAARFFSTHSTAWSYHFRASLASPIFRWIMARKNQS